ncbi:MAG: hypothetical protein J2P57_11185 [Acidimicrobiaceae bacterium]|nr:hypothetical protein [Acidimicrobiaceae bacterium]
MTAGLPGVGLSGLFALLSGLLMPPVALWRHAFGTPRAKGYRYGLCFVLAVGIAACASVLWDTLSMMVQFVSGRAQAAFRIFGLPTVAISVILLAVILLLAEGVFLAIGAAFETGRSTTSATNRWPERHRQSELSEATSTPGSGVSQEQEKISPRS